MKDDVNDATEIGDLISTMPEVPWDSFEDELGSHQLGDSRLRLLIASDSVLFSLFERSSAFVVAQHTIFRAASCWKNFLINFRDT